MSEQTYIPNYIIDGCALASNNINIIQNNLLDLCHDEYIIYWDFVPKELIIGNGYILINECAKNNSFSCLKYLIERGISLSLVHKNIWSLLTWAITSNSNKFLREFKKDNYLGCELKKIPSTNCQIIVKTKNIEGFKIFFDDYQYMPELSEYFFQIAYENDNFEILQYLYEKYNFNLSVLNRTFNFQRYIFDAKSFIWLFEKIKYNLNNQEIIQILSNKSLCKEILEYIEKINIFNDNELISIYLKCFENLLYSIQNNPARNENCLLIKEHTFYYLYEKLRKDISNDYRKEIFNKLKYSRTQSFVQICKFLIEEGIVIEDFRELYYDYYNYIKTIRERAEYVDNICKRREKTKSQPSLVYL